MKRRDFIAALAIPLAAPALVGLARKSPRKIAGRFVDDGGAIGHRIRDRQLHGGAREAVRVPVAIVGGGIAGLSAAWELRRRGMHDFVLLELEREVGGNSRSGENEISAYPWAAHYVPVPDAGATLVRELFEELGVLRNGVWEERSLAFTPQERLFMHGEWQDGITPEAVIGRADRDAFARFDEIIAAERAGGRFRIPMERGVDRSSALDRISMAEWLSQHGLDAPALRWYVDYACRDDYGALARDTSAWAGVHYFASRQHEDTGPLTWPEGNAWVTKRLAKRCAAQTRTGEPVVALESRGSRWHVHTTRADYSAEAVIFAAPAFLLPHLDPALEGRAVPRVYSPWLTANLTLERWPRSRGREAPVAWDNVIYDSPALGYVVATHQSLATHQERSVWTYYWALAHEPPATARGVLLQRSWAEWVELILADLSRAHPDVRECVSRVDIMRMGHAMVRPVPGMLAAGTELRALERPGLVLANSDVSGLSLFEEAQYRGVAGARRVLGSVLGGGREGD
jgi:glycine/D-amino acid oxidase-like deaminating enzyme